MKVENIINSYPLFIVGMIFILTNSCSEDVAVPGPVLVSPVLTTSAANLITQTTAISGGNVTSDGGSPVTVRGICWSTGTTPTITDSKTIDGAGTGIFTSNIIGLTPNTKYYVRAYATNSVGASYGSAKLFTTQMVETVTDIDGNIYHTVTIGTQVWMVENLKVTTYNDGTAIPLVIDNSAWSKLTTGGYCWYKNDGPTYKNTYGALYNWYTVNTGKLCPIGWHVPTEAEWKTLLSYLGGDGYTTVNKLKEAGTAHWLSPNAEATNESGFTALPGGTRYESGVFYANIGEIGIWWSSTEDPTTNAWLRDVTYVVGSGVGRSSFGKAYGSSVRCLKD